VAGTPFTCQVPGVHCQAIMESRHIDVLEWTPPSHLRRRYVRSRSTTSGDLCAGQRSLQVYIIDRSPHALDPQRAFNAPEDREEPPEHAQMRVRHHRDPQGR